MELRHLRYFLTLAEELHFGNAAKRLFISQPPLSRQIKELEEELGAILFFRDNKRVELTEAGKFFRKETEMLMKKLASVQQQTYQIHHSLAGEIKIGYISSVDKSKLGLLIQKLQKLYPYVQTKLFELSTIRQIEALDNGKMDIGIIRSPSSSPHLATEQLYKDGFCLAVPNAFDLPATFSTLAKEPFISYHAKYAPVYHNEMLAYCAQMGFMPTLHHECNNISSILELVHLNAGITVVPQSVQYQYSHLAIRFINVDKIAIKTDILLAYAKENEHPVLPIMRQFILDLFKKS
ncbi:LysR family transcriptional regulator [Sphingobacterium phlebotomi]|uniref:LysR family transcriptional regulator n=1 Tax=Sphingobacterium phlebotomi TaxID=2605433 RepID=A0A5D4H2S3_9SPHI|nr:LysR substrate-binding domain-containing protein [Sphingobacterium phlebotomi]TYR35331.1 LysR family transcriptional regulator [Sphingobacterium phlebotomi]